MFGWGELIPIVAIASGSVGWIATTWIRARHGYPITDDWGNQVGKDGVDGDRRVQLLTDDNARLAGQVSRLEERIAVLERIATDPAERTARAIDALR